MLNGGSRILADVCIYLYIFIFSIYLYVYFHIFVCFCIRRASGPRRGEITVVVVVRKGFNPSPYFSPGRSWD